MPDRATFGRSRFKALDTERLLSIKKRSFLAPNPWTTNDSPPSFSASTCNRADYGASFSLVCREKFVSLCFSVSAIFAVLLM